jgi:hypothetical protein
MSEVAMEGVAPGPRTVTIERRWAIGGAVVTALVIAALAVALIFTGGDGRDAGPEGFAPAGFSAPMGEIPQGPPPGMPPEGALPEGMPVPPQDVIPEGGSSRGSGSGT